MKIDEEKLIVANNMKKISGNFCKCLAELIYAADDANLKKIKTTWIDYWNKYLNDGIKK
jgi:hypothetical protein